MRILVAVVATVLVVITAWGSLEKEKKRSARIRTAIGLIGASSLIWLQWWQAAGEGKARRQRMVEAVAAELMVNLEILKELRSPTGLQSESRALPRFQMPVLAGALVSGLFLDERDRRLFTGLTHVHEVLEDMNRRLEETQEQIWRKPDKAEEVRRSIAGSRGLEELRQRLVALGTMLVDEYGIGRERVFFVDEWMKTPAAAQ